MGVIWTKYQRVCATCRHWTGPRVFRWGSRDRVEVEPNAEGQCLLHRGWSRQRPSQSCPDWEPLDAFR